MPMPRSVIVARRARGICQNGNFSKQDFPGHTDCVSDTPYPGGSLFFSTDCAGDTNCVSVFVPNGQGVFRLYQAGELRSAERGRLPRPRLGQRGRDTCGFPSSLNSYLSLGDSTAKIGEAGPLRNRGTAVGLSQRVFREIFAVRRQRTATHVGYVTQSAT